VLEQFIGQWCLVQTKNGVAVEVTVSGVSPEFVAFSELVVGYQGIPGVMPEERLIEPHAGVIARSDILIIRAADRKKTETLLSRMNGTGRIATPGQQSGVRRLN
jgi:hypothetical protein